MEGNASHYEDLVAAPTMQDQYSYTDTSYELDASVYSDGYTDNVNYAYDASGMYTDGSEKYSSMSDGSSDLGTTTSSPNASRFGFALRPSPNASLGPESKKKVLDEDDVPDLSQWKERDWNKEFQDIMTRAQFLFTDPNFEGNDAIEWTDSFSALSQLADDFTYASKLYAKVIISELHVPVEHKTIKPSKMGGIAGGDKYICGGILFKFALDVRGLYGGDEYAMKAASHELKGLQCLFPAGIALDLHFPLMSVIDYRGYRVVAMSVLPISSETIIYGSADAGVTVHSKDTTFNSRMATAAKSMNLKAHKVGPQNVEVYGPGDIEGHKSNVDGKYYLVDYARLMPPQVKINESTDYSKRQTHLFQLLRPELLLSNLVPLSSDALTGLSRFDPDRSVHNTEVQEASKRLFEQVIPSFALRLTKEADETTRASSKLCGLIHEAGINLRHLGRLWIAIPASAQRCRTAILTEMVARAMKDDIKAQLRLTMRRVRVPSEGPYRRKVIEYLNRVFVLSTEEYWREILPEMVSAKFAIPVKVIIRENPDFEVSKEDLLIRFQELSGVKFAPNVTQLLQLGTSLLTGKDVELRVCVKNLSFVDQSAACSMCVQAFKRDGSEAQRLFAQAYTLFTKASSAASLSWSTFFQWGAALRLMASRMLPMAFDKNSLQVLREAILRLEKSILSNPTFHGSHLESFICVVDAISHPGRDITATAIKRDTQHFFELGVRHLSTALQIERLSDLETDLITKRSVERLKNEINAMDHPKLLSLVQLLLNCSESKAAKNIGAKSATFTLGELSASTKSIAIPEFDQVKQKYLNLIAKRLKKAKSFDIAEGSFYDTNTISEAIANLSSRKLRSMRFNNSDAFVDSILSMKAPVEISKSKGKSTKPAAGLGDLEYILSNVKELDLSGCSKVTSAPPELKNIKNLVLVGSSLTDDQISQALSSLRSLESLDISSCRKLTGRVFEIISKTKPLLSTLIVSRGQDRPLDIKDPLISLETLTKLDISGILSVGKQSLQRLADGCESLKHLNLSSVTGTTDAHLLPLFKKLSKLAHLDLTATEMTNATLKSMGQNLTSLQTLIIKLNHGLTGDIGLSHVVRTNTLLESLDLSNLFKMKDSTFTFLNSDACPKFTNLQSLRLDVASELTEASLRWISPKFPELQSLSITAFPGVTTPTLVEFSKNNTNLTKLWLHGTEGVSGDGMQAIFSKCTKLTSLSVAECQNVTDRSFRVMNKYITTLTELDISELNNVTPMMVQAILQKNPNMRKIFVLGNRIPGIFMYQECRHNCPRLQIITNHRMRVSPCLWVRPEEVNNVDPFWQRMDSLK